MHFFNKQPFYKQLALGLPNNLQGSTPHLLSNSKNCSLKKSGVFPLK